MIEIRWIERSDMWLIQFEGHTSLKDIKEMVLELQRTAVDGRDRFELINISNASFAFPAAAFGRLRQRIARGLQRAEGHQRVYVAVVTGNGYRNRAYAHMYRHIVQAPGYQVHISTTGAEAVRWLRLFQRS